MAARKASWQSTILVFVMGVSYALGVQLWARPLTLDGLHFHPWSSEDMMQTVALGELRRQPLQSLTHIHIQPPGFDAIRAVLASFWPAASDSAALQRVDHALYVLGAILLGLMVALVYFWLAAQSGPLASALGALAVLLHPASIMFATFLDSTLLSAFLVLCSCYLLWRIKHRSPTSALLFSAVVLGLFFTRSIFQWPALLLFAVSLLLIGAARRSVWTFMLVTCLIATLYLAKQYRQFGIFSTSSLSGVSLANSIGVGMGTAKYGAYLDDRTTPTAIEPGMPGVLTARTKLHGQPNFNHIDYLTANRLLSIRYVAALRNDSLGELIRNYAENAAIYFRPTSTYSSGHVIVEHLPWRSLFDWFFSAPVLPSTLLLAFLAWLPGAVRSRTVAADLGMALPAVFVVLVSIFADKGENMRFKYFVEPAMIVLLVSQISALVRAWRKAPNGSNPAGRGPSRA